MFRLEEFAHAVLVTLDRVNPNHHPEENRLLFCVAAVRYDLQRIAHQGQFSDTALHVPNESVRRAESNCNYHPHAAPMLHYPTCWKAVVLKAIQVLTSFAPHALSQSLENSRAKGRRRQLTRGG